MPPSAPGAVVFDLDGTLVDSLADIAEAANWALELLGLPDRPIADYRYLVGEGIPKLCQRAIGDDHPDLVGRMEELTRARYRVEHLAHTKPYPGVPELVAVAKRRAGPIGVLSNKPHELTVRVTEAFWPNGTFDWIQGYDVEDRRKPNPFHLRAFCEQFRIPPAETWLVGDTPTDIETARRAGARCVAVTWGFRPRATLAEAGAEWIVDQPHEIQAWLSNC